MSRLLLSCLILILSAPLARSHRWTVEAESGGHVEWLADGTADIHAPGGLTLWCNTFLKGNVTIDYDARILSDVRVSDLNCFWMAGKEALTKAKERGGKFLNSYALSMYYMGYGGNHNTTTRFRRYDGDAKGVTDPLYRPAILREYTDSAHLLKGDSWYHIRLEQHDGRIRYYIKELTNHGDTVMSREHCLVDFLDIAPYTEGYFGFRTTLSHAQMKNFRVTQQPLPNDKYISLPAEITSPQTFGIPFLMGELQKEEQLQIVQGTTTLPSDQWNLAYWPDGSVKWRAAAVVPGKTPTGTVPHGSPVRITPTGTVPHGSPVRITPTRTGTPTSFCAAPRFFLEQDGHELPFTNVVQEQSGKIRSCTRYEGKNFVARLYTYKGSPEQKLVVTHFIDSLTNERGLQSLAVRFKVAQHGLPHQRSVLFLTSDSTLQTMHVKPLIARRPIRFDASELPADSISSSMLSDIAAWDGFRLSQLSPNAFSIRKRATHVSPWIGTIEGYRAPGLVALTDKVSTTAFHLADFWQSYPSSLQVDNARSDTAIVSLYLWSKEAERMLFQHYDTIAHGLEAAYEDVQPGMSTAYGIARTSIIYIYNNLPPVGSADTDWAAMCKHRQYTPSPQYLHRKRAFGIWSLDRGTHLDSLLNYIKDFYAHERERNSWYGYFNYGDVMHSRDIPAAPSAENINGPVYGIRDEWRYDVGGYAWDNTELGTPAMLWYQFLRTGDRECYNMAAAMTRHNSEVDCYHLGPHKGLGTRHNVLHWGCGAKEARISEAFWNRFMYYLTADERLGDLLHEVVDADQLLYTLDPMRLAQPRSAATPCTAPARLRIGPDWLAYASNWFTEWERTLNNAYRDKIVRGMQSISSLPHGIFSGPKALGYDPATGIITWEGDTAMQNTNHLLPIMGGFEMMNEMMLSFNDNDNSASRFTREDNANGNHKNWRQTWLDFCCQYKEKAWNISKNKFRIPRLQGYAWWYTGNPHYLNIIRKDLWLRKPILYTNNAATFALDAIFLQEVTPVE